MSHPSAQRLAGDILARGLRPPPRVRVSDWIAENIVLVDGPQAGQLWSPKGAPYLVEIADCLSDDHPANLVTVRKSQQTGASILALAWCLYVAEREPANMLFGAPGLDALRKTNNGKLTPLIDAMNRRRAKDAPPIILPQTARSGDGSTTYEKVFARGGRLWLGNANSVMDLSSVTIKKGVKDELSKWTDIPGYGDPENLFFGRFTAFRRLKDWKILEISTPEVDSGDETGDAPGHCRIDRSFRRSDQRYWHLACPECGSFFYHRNEHFRVDRASPHKSTYECQDCGHQISETERVLQLAPENGAHWRAMLTSPGRHPGFHIDGFISLMVSYEAMAEESLNSEKSETAKKDFSTLWLGLPHAFRGDAPEWKRLFDRSREALHIRRGYIPPDGLILTAAVDVQMRGVWFEVVSWGADGSSTLVDAGYIDGETDKHTNEVFARLERDVLDRQYPDAWGRDRTVDALGIDSGYRANIVYAWTRARQRQNADSGRDVILALKGDEGWGKPALGTPTLVDIDLDGRKIKQGCKLWKVGTWPLKSTVYGELGKSALGPNEFQPGYCHFGAWVDEVYFRQLTSEYLEDIKVRGRTTGRRWVANGENHLHDCRVYNRALAEYLGLSSSTREEWAALARRRGLPDELLRTDLFTPAQSEPSEPVAQTEAAPNQPATDDWLGGRADNW